MKTLDDFLCFNFTDILIFRNQLSSDLWHLFLKFLFFFLLNLNDWFKFFLGLGKFFLGLLDLLLFYFQLSQWFADWIVFCCNFWLFLFDCQNIFLNSFIKTINFLFHGSIRILSFFDLLLKLLFLFSNFVSLLLQFCYLLLQIVHLLTRNFSFFRILPIHFHYFLLFHLQFGLDSFFSLLQRFYLLFQITNLFQYIFFNIFYFFQLTLFLFIADIHFSKLFFYTFQIRFKQFWSIFSFF